MGSRNEHDSVSEIEDLSHLGVPGKERYTAREQQASEGEDGISECQYERYVASLIGMKRK